ncbi:MAG: acetyl-CoA carboxylase biotin carboxylase subunit [Myxococcota bacterium]
MSNEKAAGSPLFAKVLIANRGEIACRVIRACRARGIRTVAVFSEADRAAVHVRMADEAFCIGPPPSRESYLVGERILEVAKKTGAEAIHPGYGFLSENAEFREAVAEAGLVFIGPPASAMRLMGSKTLARRTMIDAGVPVVPGTADPIEDEDELVALAKDMGYPVMLKAAAGGGGKGMRIIRDADELVKGWEAARREALSSFGDDTVYVEKAIVGPRHIEVQVVADTHGNVVYVGDRECSVQRRHQKVVEESPAPSLTGETRRQMGEMAVQAARAVHYEGAGTVECLVDSEENFYFLEMNTRLQVEHCATEEAFGVDLVDAQLQVASGGELPWGQDELVAAEHAIELRIYAEDPYQNNLPSPGTLSVYRAPKGPGVRVDDGVESGSVVSPLYDPMVAKLICSGDSRDLAIRRCLAALREYAVEGIRCNIPLLEHVLHSEPFRAGRYTTALLDELPPLERPEPTPEIADLARVLAAVVTDEEARAGHRVVEGREQVVGWSHWALDGLRRSLRGEI